MENIQISPEEANAEIEAQREVKEEEVRASVIAEFGFDEVDDAEKINKLVQKEVSHRKNLSQAIGQKIKYRDQIGKPLNTPVKPSIDPDELQKKIDTGVLTVLEQRDLESMEYPDELKGEISRIAKTNGISVKKALSDPYIQFKIGEYDRVEKTENASISRTNNGAGGKPVYSVDTPPDVDVSTPEGAKAYDEWFEKARKDPKYQPNM